MRIRSAVLMPMLREKLIMFLALFSCALFAIYVLALTVHAQEAPSDIAGNTNAEAITYLYERGVIGGYSDGTFKPRNGINRAELAKILVTAKGANPTVDQYHDCFSDVTTEWFAPYVCYAKEQGWVAGYSDGSYRPSNPVITVEAIKMILNAQDISASASTSENTYTDVDTNAWYAPFVQTANSKGLLEIARGKLNVNNNMTRGGVAEMIYRALSIKTSGAAKFIAKERPQGQGRDFNPSSQDLQKYIDEANAAADKTVLTKEQFTAEMTAQRQQQMEQLQQQFGQQSSRWGGGFGAQSSRPFIGQRPENAERRDPIESAVTFWKYTNPEGEVTLLAIDASGKVIMKFPTAFGGARPFPPAQ